MNVDLDCHVDDPRDDGATGARKIARGEAMECAASLDVMRLRKLVAPPQYDHGIRLLEDVVAMRHQDALTVNV